MSIMSSKEVFTVCHRAQSGQRSSAWSEESGNRTGEPRRAKGRRLVREILTAAATFVTLPYRGRGRHWKLGGVSLTPCGVGGCRRGRGGRGPRLAAARMRRARPAIPVIDYGSWCEASIRLPRGLNTSTMLQKSHSDKKHAYTTCRVSSEARHAKCSGGVRIRSVMSVSAGCSTSGSETALRALSSLFPFWARGIQSALWSSLLIFAVAVRARCGDQACRRLLYERTCQPKGSFRAHKPTFYIPIDE